MKNEVDSIRAKYHRDVMEAVEYGDGDFYVYIHFRNDTGFPFYVGKGSRNGYYDRVKIKDRSYNPYWQRIVAKHGYTAKVIRNCGSDEKLSHDYERELVALFRGMGFGITNLTNGGEGVSGWVPSEETRKRISEAQSGKTHSDESKRKMSEVQSGKNNSFWNKSHSDETKQKMSEVKAGENNPQFCGYSIGYNETKIIIFCGKKDMVNRGFNPGHISQIILKNPKYKSHKGYSFIRTDSPADVYHLLEGREFADEESRVHWEYFDSHYF